jgi:SAM-dependent methyltransferase
VTKLYSEHADLYARAFEWDVEEEVDWLLERLGSACRSVLEPGCGTGRYLEELGRRGIEAVGIDNAPEMVEAASRRGTAVLADMTAFDLGRMFDGAICAISTLAVLAPAACARHLACMARHLRPAGRYLVQLAIRDPARPEEAIRSSKWERAGVRVTWSTEDVDLVRGVERQRSRIEVLEGQRAGEIVEEAHVVTAWTPASWARVVDASPFEVAAVYDAEKPGRARVDRGSAGRLLWHELITS